jgi:hypothetical protein
MPVPQFVGNVTDIIERIGLEIADLQKLVKAFAGGMLAHKRLGEQLVERSLAFFTCFLTLQFFKQFVKGHRFLFSQRITPKFNVLGKL